MWHLLLFLPALMQADGCPPGYSPCNVNKCFMAVQARRTWPRAQRHCVETGGTLATITSVSQNDCVSGLTQGGTSPYWIGMVQIGDSGHQWVDGSEVSFSKWKEDEKEKDYPFTTFLPSTGNWGAEKSGVVFGQYFICSATPSNRYDKEETFP